jgi:hypothetical protein
MAACLSTHIGTRRASLGTLFHGARGRGLVLLVTRAEDCSTTTGHAAFTPLISPTLHAQRMSGHGHITSPSSSSICQQPRATRRRQHVASFLLPVSRRTGQPHSVVRGSILLLLLLTLSVALPAPLTAALPSTSPYLPGRSADRSRGA